MDLKTLLSSQVWAIELKALEGLCAQAVQGVMESSENEKNVGRLYNLVGTVALVPVRGVISKCPSWFGGGADTFTIRRALDLAVMDSDVKQICIYIDSPGGTVDGVSDLSDHVRAVAAKKPVIAFGSGMIASAAYWIGCAATKLVVSQDAIVGSIGVYTVLADFSTYMAQMGVKHELIRTGKFKGSDVPLFPISKEARIQSQDLVDSFFTLFVEKVAAYRGMDLKTAQSLSDGKVYVGKTAVELGLADGLGTLDSVIAMLATEIQEDTAMGRNAKKGVEIVGGLRSLGSILTSKAEDDEKAKKAAEDEEMEDEEKDEDEDEEKAEADEEKAEGDEDEDEEKKSKKAIIGRNVTLASATESDLVAARPDLCRRIARKAAYREEQRQASVRQLISSAKLPVIVTAQLEGSLANASVEHARESVDRACSIEAAIELGRMHGVLKQEDEQALRADVASFRVHAAISYIRSFVEKKLESTKQTATTVAVTQDTATQVTEHQDKEKKLVADLRVQFESIKDQHPNLDLKGFIFQGLQEAGVTTSEEALAKAYPDLVK